MEALRLLDRPRKLEVRLGGERCFFKVNVVSFVYFIVSEKKKKRAVILSMWWSRQPEAKLAVVVFKYTTYLTTKHCLIPPIPRRSLVPST